MEMEFTVNILFTEAAKAVQRQPTFQVSQALPLSLAHVAVGDLVETPPCTKAFVVIDRQWTIEPHATCLNVILDLPKQRTGPTAVS